MTSMDLLPMFCELAKVKLPHDRKIDGINTLPVVMGEQTDSPHEFLYDYNGTNLQAVRDGNWKLHLPRTTKDQPFWSKVVKGKGQGRKENKGNAKAKLTKKGFITLAEHQLFNLESDIGEKKNVAAENPDVVARLKNQAEVIRAELGDARVIGSDQRKINLVDPQER